MRVLLPKGAVAAWKEKTWRKEEGNTARPSRRGWLERRRRQCPTGVLLHPDSSLEEALTEGAAVCSAMVSTRRQ